MFASVKDISDTISMTEQCPARAIELDMAGDVITEANIHAECMRCIQRAMDDPTIPKETIDTYNEGLARAREAVKDTNATVPEEEFDRWRAITLSAPQEGLARQAIEEYGFDLGIVYGASYEQGSETKVITVGFDCYGEASSEQL